MFLPPVDFSCIFFFAEKMELFELAIKFHFFRGRKTMDEEKDPQPTSPVAEEAQPAKKAKSLFQKRKR